MDIEESQTGGSDQPAVTLIPEMKPVALRLSKERPDLPEADRTAFDQAWSSLRPKIAKRITRDSVVAISRWAVKETETLDLPSGWIDQLAMRPLRCSKDDRYVLFGQSERDGLPLPAHSPLVYRRLKLFPIYDRTTKSISEIYVTIRGWVEE